MTPDDQQQLEYLIDTYGYKRIANEVESFREIVTEDQAYGNGCRGGVCD